MAAVSVYSSDDRQAVALLLLPFVLMTLAIGISQSMKRMGPLPEIAILSPKAPAQKATQQPAAPGPLGQAWRAITRKDVAALPPATVPAPAATIALRPALALPPSANDAQAARPLARAVDAVPPSIAGGVVAATPQAMPSRAAVAAPADSSREALAPTAPVTTALPHVASLDLTVRVPQSGLVEPRPMPPPATVTAVERALDGAGAPAKNICVAAASRFAQPARLGAGVATADRSGFGSALAAAARAQTEDMVVYTDNYRRLAYPMGDVSSLFGVCTDVVIRAYRSVGVDLQTLVHEARVGSGDTSIQHRRVETLRRFFSQRGATLPVTEFAEDYRPGDVVTYHRPQNRHSRSHIAIVAEEIGPSGNPMIIHNRGWGPQLEDGLFVDEITGHYRFDGGAPETLVAAKGATAARTAGAAPAAATVQPVTVRSGPPSEPSREAPRRGLSRKADTVPAPNCAALSEGARRAGCLARQARVNASPPQLGTP